MSLAVVLDKYLAERRSFGEMTFESARMAKYAIAPLFDLLDEDDPSCLTREVVARYLNTRNWSPRSRAARTGTLRAFFDWLVECELIPRNPLPRGRRRRGQGTRSQPRALSPVQVVALFAHSPDTRMTLILSLMLQAGLRCCEVAALQWADINLGNRTLVVVGKYGKERTLYITDELLEDLLAYLAEVPPIDGPLIRASWNHPGAKGLSAAWISRMVCLLMRDVGIVGRTAHCLRHTAATDLADRGVDLRDIQEFLGHANIGTTEIYTKRRVSKLREVAEGRRYHHEAA